MATNQAAGLHNMHLVQGNWIMERTDYRAGRAMERAN